jgi:hypothetical protein
MRERTNSLVFGGPLLTPISSLDNTPMGKRRRRSNSINDSPNSRLRSPDRTYNISSKTGPNDQNYEEISQLIIDEKERNILEDFRGNKHGKSFAGLKEDEEIIKERIGNEVLKLLGLPPKKTKKRNTNEPKTNTKRPKTNTNEPKTNKRKRGGSTKTKKRKRGGSTKTKKRKIKAKNKIK